MIIEINGFFLILYITIIRLWNLRIIWLYLWRVKRSSYNSSYRWLNLIIKSGRFIPRFISSYFNFSSLIINNPFTCEIILRFILQICFGIIGFSYYFFYLHWLLVLILIIYLLLIFLLRLLISINHTWILISNNFMRSSYILWLWYIITFNFLNLLLWRILINLISYNLLILNFFYSLISTLFSLFNLFHCWW